MLGLVDLCGYVFLVPLFFVCGFCFVFGLFSVGCLVVAFLVCFTSCMVVCWGFWLWVWCMLGFIGCGEGYCRGITVRKGSGSMFEVAYTASAVLQNTSSCVPVGCEKPMAPVGTRYMIKEDGLLSFLKAIYYRALNSKDDEE
jgi:hypothetical protein